MSKKVLWITQTGVLVALLIVAQMVTASLGNTMITGSIVNLILIVSVMLCGVYTGVSVAVVSPICAKFFGIGPLWSLIPFIAIGNLVIVMTWYFRYIGDIFNTTANHRIDRRWNRSCNCTDSKESKYREINADIAKMKKDFIFAMFFLSEDNEKNWGISRDFSRFTY